MFKRLFKGIGANAFGQLVIIGLQLIQVPLMANQWGLDRYGLWLMLSTIPSYLAISDLGFGKAAIIDMTMKIAIEDQDGARRTYQSAAALVGVTATALMVILITIAVLLPERLFGTAVPLFEARTALLILIAYGAIALASSFAAGPMQSTGNYAIDSTCWAIAWGMEGVAAIVVVLLGGDMVVAALAMLIVRVVSLVTITFIALRVAPVFRPGVRHASMAEVRRLMRPAIAMMNLPVANALVLQGTAMAVGLGASPAAIPAFTAVRTLSRVPMQLTNIVIRAVMPEFSAAVARGDKDAEARLINLSVLATLLLLLPFAILMVIGGSAFVRLWTHGAIHVPLPVIAVMALVLLANGLWTPLSNLVVAANRQALFTYHFLAFAVIATGLAYWLSRRFGTLGGPLAMLIVDLLMLVLLVRVMSRLFGPVRMIVARMGQDMRGGADLLRRIARRR